MVTGEYGDRFKRPHWHAILFNFRPPDQKYLRTTDLEYKVYSSQFVDEIWGKGKTEFGDVSFEAAGYVARYAAKKLVHGRDQDHDFHPKHRTSSKIPLGRPWIEKYWQQTFTHGYIVLPSGKIAGIPRYYEDWFREQHTQKWMDYASTVKIQQSEKARALRAKEEALDWVNVIMRSPFDPAAMTRNQVKEFIQQKKHDEVLKGLKL